MKAGQALGLLAGMGALSALGRGADLKGNRFTGLLDMIDGGGGGKSGDRFEGGGLLSMLSNLFAKPYEAQQRVEDIAARAATRNTTPSTTGGSEPMLIQPLLDAAPVGTGNPLVDRIIEDRKEQVVMDQPVVPAVTPDVYNIGSAGEFAGSMLAPSNPAPSYANMYIGEAGRGVPDLPRPVATTAALSPAGNIFSGAAPVPPSSEQLGLIAPATSRTPYPSAMPPEAPYIPQEIMSFREFVDAERAAMSGADRYLDPANYRRGYARYLRSMGIDPAAMGM